MSLFCIRQICKSDVCQFSQELTTTVLTSVQKSGSVGCVPWVCARRDRRAIILFYSSLKSETFVRAEHTQPGLPGRDVPPWGVAAAWGGPAAPRPCSSRAGLRGCKSGARWTLSLCAQPPVISFSGYFISAKPFESGQYLDIYGITRDQAGEYECSAENDVSVPDVKKVKVTVNCKSCCFLIAKSNGEEGRG